MANKMSGNEKPKDIKFDGEVVDICFHPKRQIIAAGDISGEVTLWRKQLVNDITASQKACRALKFSPDGEHLYTASKDKSIQVIDLNTGTVKSKIKKAHTSPIYCLLVTGETFLASGDDDGHLKVWDLRSKSAVMELKENDDFISDMVIDNQNKILVTSSGDGTLTAINIRRKRMELQSELFDSELLSLALVKGKQKIVCGSGEGVLNIFNWGQFGNISDRFPGHPMSIDCMVALSDDIICTGSSDGVVRAVNILPNRILGVIGEHDDFPVENLSLSHDETLLASCSHDQKIKFWNVTDIKSEKVDAHKKAKKTNKPKYLNSTASDNFFSGLDDTAESAADSNKQSNDDNDSDDNDDDSDDDDNDSNDEDEDSDESKT